MDLPDLRTKWERLGRNDPLWAIYSVPGKQGNRWSFEEFFASGEGEVDRLLEHVAKLNRPRRRLRALDFGCGVGRLTQALGGHFEEVIGVDIAESMLELANLHNRRGDRCRYVHNTRDDLAFINTGSCDLVYTSMVLQHMPPSLAQQYVDEFVRVLSPGGVATFQIPGGRARWAEQIKRALQSPRPVHHVRVRGTTLIRSRLLAGRGGLTDQPVIEMFTTDETEVRRWVSTAGGTTLQVIPILSTSPFHEYHNIEYDDSCYIVVRADDH